MRKAFEKHGDRYMNTLEALSQRSDERHRLARTVRRKESRTEHHTLCVLAERAILEMTALLTTLETLETRLRGLTSSFELQQAQDKRPADLLLTTVYQHLHWGGLSYSEISRLVPDGERSKRVVDRVRKRVSSPNAWSMMPRELLGKRAMGRPKEGGNQSAVT